MSKILFLDFDGVLNPYVYSNALYKMYAQFKDNGMRSRDQYGDYFAPWCVDELRNIVEWTGCQIVVISTWRCYCDVEQMWKDRRLPGECIGTTPKGLGGGWAPVETTRGIEVRTWCEWNGIPDKFCIIDDTDEFTGVWGEKNYIQTKSKYGLTREETEKAIEMLL